MKINDITNKVFELYRDHIVNELRILPRFTIVAAVSDPREGGKALIYQPKESADEYSAWLAAVAVKELGGDESGGGVKQTGEDDVFTYYEAPLPHL